MSAQTELRRLECRRMLDLELRIAEEQRKQADALAGGLAEVSCLKSREEATCVRLEALCARLERVCEIWAYLLDQTSKKLLGLAIWDELAVSKKAQERKGQRR